jgi:hypothetical protein
MTNTSRALARPQAPWRTRPSGLDPTTTHHCRAEDSVSCLPGPVKVVLPRHSPSSHRHDRDRAVESRSEPAGSLLVLLALTAPSLLRPFHFLWMKLSWVLGLVMNRVILGLLFFVFFTLTGLIGRLAGRDPLQLKFRKPRESY